MPISKYNPDGTVDIYNKKTGQVMTGLKPEQLGGISPRLVAEYQAGQSPESVLARKETEVKLKELENPQLKDEFASKKKTALDAVTNLEKLYGRGDSANLGTGNDLSLSPSATFVGKARGKAASFGKKVFDSKFQEDLNVYRSSLEAVAGVFSQAFGSGTPQEAEAKRFMESAPSANSTDREAAEWFRNVKIFLGKNEDELPPTPPDLEKKRNPIAEFFLGSGLDFAQDIGSGIALKGKTGDDLEAAQQQAIEMANQAFDKAQTVTDPEQKSKLEKVAMQTLKQVGLDAKSLEGRFSDSMDKPYTQRGLEVGTEVAALAELPSLVKGVTNFAKGGLPKTPPSLGENVVKTGEKIESMTPRSIFGRKQAEAAAKVTESPAVQKVVDAGRKLADVDPDVEKILMKELPKLENIQDMSTLLERMQVWGRNAYSKSGGVKSAAKSSLYDEFYKAGTEILKTQAPEVYKYRSLLRFSYELPKTAGRALWRATLGRFAFGV